MREMNREDKSTILLISGVKVSTIPVLQHFIQWSKGLGLEVDVVENAGKERGVRFVSCAMRALSKRRADKVIFANVQSAFVLLLAQVLGRVPDECWYWAFESTRSVKMFSPVWLGIYAEKLMRHQKVDLIIPIQEREIFFTSRYRTISVFENAPMAGEVFRSRRLEKGHPVQLVFFGNLDPKITYIFELLKLVQNRPDLFSISIIGSHPDVRAEDWVSEAIRWVGRLPYDEMCELLKCNFHYSVVGYKPVDFNYEYCAPNKLFESFSFSLPVLGNRINPTVKRIIEGEGGGLLEDFNALRPAELYEKLFKDYESRVLRCFDVYNEKYNFESILKKSTLSLLRDFSST